MRLLDLFCGAGLAAWGYWRSGRFSDIVGIDNKPMPYPFNFILGDAYHLDYEFLLGFDFIHASPPCQFYSKVTPDRTKHVRSIPPIRHMLFATGLPHVIENVEGSSKDLRPNVALTGYDVGLPHLRRRYFYCSFKVSDVRASHMSSAPGANLSSGDCSHNRIHGGHISKGELITAMGLSDLPPRYLNSVRVSHIEQGIPPAMTRRLVEGFPKVLIG